MRRFDNLIVRVNLCIFDEFHSLNVRLIVECTYNLRFMGDRFLMLEFVIFQRTEKKDFLSLCRCFIISVLLILTIQLVL